MDILINICLWLFLNKGTFCDVDSIDLDKDSRVNDISPGTLQVLNEWKESERENEAGLFNGVYSFKTRTLF